MKGTLQPGHTMAGIEKTIPLREGATKLRVILRDPATGRTGSLTIPLEKL